MSEITRKATTVRFDPKSHQKIEDVDWDKWHGEVALAAVEAWEGFVEGQSVYPCTPENTKTLVAKWFEFRKFVCDVCVDLEALVAAQKELERKNSATGSSPEKTTQG
jgi:hypothetical protein